jgi:anion-transporting  ArsA/GET3 family ATPase
MHSGVSAAETQPDLSGLLDKRLLMLIGKGGVGKSSLTAALGLAARARGKRVLLAEVRAPRRLPSLLGKTVNSDGPLELEPGLSWINFTAETALEIYAMRLLKLRTVYRAVFEQKAVRRFLRVVPSLAEILILGHLRFLLDQNQVDLVVVDAPSTGPGALMLEAPQAVIETAPAGPLRDGAIWIRELLTDPEATAINLVVLAEDLPVSEAIDLYHRLRDRVGVPLGAVFANRLLPDPFGPGGEKLLGKLADDTSADQLVQTCRGYAGRLRLQRTYLDRLLAGVPLPVGHLPEIIDPPFDSDGLTRLAAVFEPMLEGPSP